MKLFTTDFSEREKRILITILKERIDLITEDENYFFKSTESHKNFEYKPLLSAYLKLEDFDSKIILEKEKILMISCVNDNINSNKKVGIVEELIQIKNKIK